MDQCVVDTSMSDLILMIGGQILLLGVILFIITFGKMPMAFPLAQYVPLVSTTTMSNAKNSQK
jgi:hypothetical protein